MKQINLISDLVFILLVEIIFNFVLIPEMPLFEGYNNYIVINLTILILFIFIYSIKYRINQAMVEQ